MDLKIIKFDDIEIDKHKFHQCRSPISINNLDINKSLWVHIEEMLMKLNMCFFEKKWWIIRKI